MLFRSQPFDHDYGNVFTTWDLGMTDDTAIWFWQVEDGGINLIDFYQEHGKPLSHYYDVIENKPYHYIKHWLPHDARQVMLASGVSILNQMLKRWPGQVAVGPDLPLLDGIQAARWMIQKGVLFHPRVVEGLEALRQYHYEYDEEKKIFSNKPAHDWSSHVADAFRYLACVVKVSQLLSPATAAKAPGTVGGPAIARPLNKAYNLDTLFKERAEAVTVRKRI